MMKNLSLKQKILLSVVIALSLVILLLSWQSYSSQKSLLLQGSQEQLQRLGTQQAERVSDWLAARRDVIQALGNKAGAEPLNALQQAQVSGRFQLTYFGESSGKMNDSDPSINRDGYDPRSRGWYQEAMSKGGLIVTKPYLDVAYNIMVVTLAQPVSGGVVGGDLSIASLVEDVTKMQLPADGFAIMMHKDGTIIAYKDAAKAMKPASEIDNDLTNALIEQSKSSKELVPAYFDNEGRDKLLWAADIPDTDWELVLVLDKAALEAPLSSLLMTQLGMALLVLVGSILAISWLVSMLLGPLTKVSQALARIADGNGDLTQRIKIDANDEVGQLANSFNRFVGSQHQLIGNIRQLANELNADAERSLVTNQAAVDELQRQQQEVTMVATAVTEMKGGFSLAFMSLSLLLMTSLIALYCEKSLCYCFMAPPWLYLLSAPLTVEVPFMLMHLLLVIGLALLLETGRRMLYGWFVLAVAREYENLALACRLDGQAKQDPLTGLANRRYFNQVGELAIKQAMLQEHSFAVILLDVDFFKKLNDCYGHQRGDEVLVSVAGCLREVVRNQGDLVARYGGEEFVLLLPKATLAIAETVAQRVAAALARQALPHAESSVAAHVTVSQGIALWKSGESLDRVIARADEALYRAKAEGRNCYRIAPADTHPASD